MKVLIIVEDERYQQLALALESNIKVEVEVTNTDFNLSKSISNCQAVVFFGDVQMYNQFVVEYQQLLNSKLMIRTNQGDQYQLPLDIELQIISGVGVCLIPQLGAELTSIIAESLYSIFDEKIKLMICDQQNYQQVLDSINQLNSQLKIISDQYEQQLGLETISKIFENFHTN